MLIPKDVSNRKFKDGDKVMLIKDISLTYVNITKGHEMIFVEDDKYSPLLKEPNTGIIVKNLNFSDFTHNVTFKEARTINKNVKDKIKFIKFIKDNCPNKDVGYWDRDQYDSCNLKNNRLFANDECDCSFECFKYIPKEKYKNNSFILNYNRKIKLNKLKKLSSNNE
jgi:hypothetical protein